MNDVYFSFAWGFTSHSGNFHLFEDVIITGEGKMLTYARHPWSLSSEDSLGVTSTMTRDIRLK